MRILYSMAWLVLLPIAFGYLVWRALRQPEYLHHWGERLGRAPVQPDRQPVIWLHAVSVGETRASEPLVRHLLDHHPDCHIVLTHATPTGRAAGSALFGKRVTQAYLPYDLPMLVQHFLSRLQPRFGIIMETEIWPNLYAACTEHNVPLYLINCRLSERSARGYTRFKSLTQPALGALNGLAAQTEADAQRLRALGAGSVRVTGNMKFDVTQPPGTEQRADSLHSQFGSRFVWLAASTREGEEALILEAWHHLDIPDLLLVIVPRHPQRFDEVARLIRTHDPAMARRSVDGSMQAETRVYLGDSMGEMAVYYAVCDIAFIGGSLLPFGGQNPIEAAAAGVPILLGTHTWNFAAIADDLVHSEAALRIKDCPELESAIKRLYEREEERWQLGQNAQTFARSHQGATAKVLEMMEPVLRNLPAKAI